MTSTINFHLSCHCQTFTSTLSLPYSAFPLKSAICHCTICRHTTGLLFATFAVIPLPTTPSCTGLTGFASSEKITRWFCHTCGCSIWNDDRGNNEWELATGVISGVTYGELEAGFDEKGMSRGPGSPEGRGRLELIDGLLDRVQLWVESTGDGGAVPWLAGTKATERHWRDRDSALATDEMIQTIVRETTAYSNEKPTQLHATCACNAISLLITRSSPSKTFPSGIDACYSCRKSTGFEITSWITIPRENITWSDGTAITFTEASLGMYNTTPKVKRYFCVGCGAVVFCDIEGKETLDLSVGLLDCDRRDGARVEEWCVWDKYGERGVAYIEDAVDGEFVGGLVQGVKKMEEEKRVGL